MKLICPKCGSTTIMKRNYLPRITCKKTGLRIEPKFYYCVDCGREFNIK